MLQIITIICVTYVQNNFEIRASIKQLLTKYQIYTILPQISYFHKNRNFSSIFAPFQTNCFIPINFMAGTCQEYSFSFLPVVSLYCVTKACVSLFCSCVLEVRCCVRGAADLEVRAPMVGMKDKQASQVSFVHSKSILFRLWRSILTIRITIFTLGRKQRR